MNSLSGDGGRRTSTTATTGSASFDSYQFDFGLSSSRSSSSRPLRGDPKPNPTPAPNLSYSSSWTHQPATQAKPSWTHQPTPKSATNTAATSMVGDIFGKSWNSSSSSTSSSSARVGIPEKNPNLFGDLLSSALGSGRGAQSNVPLRSAAPASKNTFSMSNMSDSLPKATDFGANFASFGQASGKGVNPVGPTGQPMRSSASLSGPAPIGQQKKDPFESLSGFGSKPAPKPSPVSSNSSTKADSFGMPGKTADPISFDSFTKPPKPTNPTSFESFDGFGSFASSSAATSSPLPTQDMDMLFSSTKQAPSPVTESNDWDIGSEFMASDGGGPTTELEGLPPPPAGLTANSAKSKGMDNYKQGQYADAIKWLSWAVALLEKTGDSDSITEVLSCRASSYKEVGEYKKAIADCSKVLEQDKENVSLLIQRALLYESNEKYRLGAEDLRLVLKIDPGNRIARSTIHRLNKMAD